ncbi:MAG: hypothetical protein DRN33_06305, partial [Thermoplasmata archaeon]
MFLGVTSFSAIGVKQSLNSRISCLFGSKFAVNFGGDRLDQQQTECNDALLLDGYFSAKWGDGPYYVTDHMRGYGLYQLFVPGLHTKEITRINLYVAKIGKCVDLAVGVYEVINITPGELPNMIVLDLKYLTGTSFSSSKIYESYEWVEFDFPDIT